MGADRVLCGRAGLRRPRNYGRAQAPLRERGGGYIAERRRPAEVMIQIRDCSGPITAPPFVRRGLFVRKRGRDRYDCSGRDGNPEEERAPLSS